MQVPQIVTQFLDRARSVFGSSIGVVCGRDRLTYGTLASRIDRLSAGLRSIGVKQGDVVACLSFNCHRLLELYYAVPQMGAILLPINIRLTPDDIAFIINDATASTVVCDRALAPLIVPVRAQLRSVRRIVWMGGDASVPDPIAGDDYELLVNDSGDFVRPQIEENDVAELFYTSGTTSHPKGVMLTHRNLYAHAMSVLAMINPGSDAVQLHSIPLFHVNGWGTPHYVTFLGARHVMLPRFDPEVVLETIERERVTHMLLVPTMALALLHAPSARSRDLSSLRRIKLGGAAAAPSLVASMDELLPQCDVTCGYGLTETSPVLTIALLKPDLRGDASRSLILRSCAGLPIPGVELEILDDDGDPLPHDGSSTGEICARGNSVMAGYWKQPEDTARAMSGGWFHTGDVGALDPNGYLFIVDRKKDIIISGGENISSIEIENALYAHPAVMECAVISLPDERWGEVPAAIVVLKPGASVTDAALIAHCKQQLAGFKVPKRIKFVESLPKGGTGKILKRTLRDTYTAELSSAPVS